MTVIRLPGKGKPTPPVEVPPRPWLPEGMHASEYTFSEAIDNFKQARESLQITVLSEQAKAGLINLAHAWLWAVTDSGQVTPDEARRLFRELMDAAGAFR